MSSTRPAKTAMHELKLRRLLEHNQRLREELSRPRVNVSIASLNLINYCRATKDPLLPSVWGPVAKADDPYSPPEGGACCSPKEAIIIWTRSLGASANMPSDLEYEEDEFDELFDETPLSNVNTAAPITHSSVSLTPTANVAGPSRLPASRPISTSTGNGSKGKAPMSIEQRTEDLRVRKREHAIEEWSQVGAVTLRGACMRVIRANSARIWDVGDMEYSMIRPFIDNLPQNQLTDIEANSPHIKKDTDWLWEAFMIQDYPMFHERCNKAKEDAEDRQAAARQRLAEKYKELEKEKASKRIVMLDQIIPDPKKRAKAAKAAAASAPRNSATNSIARARQDATRARVALTHAAGKYVQPTPGRMLKGENLLLKNPYVDPNTKAKTAPVPVIGGARLPPPRRSTTTRQPAIHSRSASPPSPRPLPSAHPSHMTLNEHRAALPADVTPNKGTANGVKPYRQSEQPPQTTLRSIKKPTLSTFEQPKMRSPGVKVDFFGDSRPARDVATKRRRESSDEQGKRVPQRNASAIRNLPNGVTRSQDPRTDKTPSSGPPLLAQTTPGHTTGTVDMTASPGSSRETPSRAKDPMSVLFHQKKKPKIAGKR